ncbi:hypothetical protein L2E82_02541 [Cichorium intybus]|uniref:Uncharacterized protein n=1 Tax=Cichorium intybus TaxID=13427 RepID=A0ACB9H330_CICIN|nr:hypothetical protein L2E82_02541 [Cichorium intybus]
MLPPLLSRTTTLASTSRFWFMAAEPMVGVSCGITITITINEILITPGSLPKGLRILDISRNKICAIEGLRELTWLRILDMSYNRISRIGQRKKRNFLLQKG